MRARIVTLKDVIAHGGRLDATYYVNNNIGRPAMDPKANIDEQREIARDVIAFIDGLSESDDAENALKLLIDPSARLAELVLALDEWRTKGGFDPYVGPRNVFAVLAGTQVMLFTDEAQANEYADLSGNPLTRVALRDHEMAEDLLADWREEGGDDAA